MPDYVHEQNIGDEFIDTDNFNVMVRETNASRTFDFDPQFFEAINDYEGGTFVTFCGDLGDTRDLHFEVIQDTSYSPSAAERRIQIRGGYWQRHAYSHTEDYIKDPPPPASVEFIGASGGGLEDYAVANNTMADGDVWIVYLGWWQSDSDYQDKSGIWTDYLYADAAKGTVGSPPSRPSDPDTDGVTNQFKILATVTNNGGILTIDQEWTGGNIKDFQLQLDSDALFTPVQWIESLGYITGPSSEYEQEGLLQDYSAHESLIDSDATAKYDNDFIIMYFDYVTAGASTKKYARIDSHAAAAWGAADPQDDQRSLEINSNVFQLYNYDTETTYANSDHAVYSFIDSSGEHNIEYRWPVTFESRPRNASDGSSSTADMISQIVTGSATGSYGTAQYYDRTFTVNRATLDIGSDSGPTDFYITINNVNSSDISWDDVLHHDQTDATASGYPDASWPSATNGNHDPRYWFYTGAGTDTKDFHTTGECHADDFKLQDAPATSFWNDGEFETAVPVFDINSAAVTFDGTTFSVDMTGNSNITSSAGTLDLISSGTLTIDSTAADLDIDAATSIEIESGTFAVITTGVDFDVVAAGDATITADDIDLTPTNDVEVTSGDLYVNLGDFTVVSGNNIVTAGFYQCQGDAGQTLADWFTGGIMIGTSITEKTVSALNPSDRVLVI